MTGARYNRVSKKEQQQDSDALTRQLWQTERAAKQLGGEWLNFTDVQSGRRDDRPEFQKLIAAIEAREVKRLVISRIDRITRDLEMNARLAKLFEKLKVEVYEILLGRTLDFKNPNDWDYFVRSGIKAEGESRMLSARIKQTFDWQREQGKLAGGQVPYGYMKGKESGLPEPNPDEWDKAVQRVLIILEIGSPNLTAAARIREETGKYVSRPGLIHWIKNPMIRGHLVRDIYLEKRQGAYDRTPNQIIPNTHPSLFADPRLASIDAESRIDTMISQNRAKKGRNRKARTYPLQGLVYCGRCGVRAHIKTAKSAKYPDKEYTFILCGDRDRGYPCGGEIGVNQGRRGTVNTPYDYADGIVMKALWERGQELIRATQAPPPEAPEPTPEMTQLSQEIARLEALHDPDLKDAINAKKSRLKKMSLDLLGSQDTDKEKEEALMQLCATEEFWLFTATHEKEAIYQKFVHAVKCDRREVLVDLSV